VARRAEAEGYSSLWVSDHILVPAAGGTIPALEILEPIATLAYVAAVTSRIRLATSVIVVPIATRFTWPKSWRPSTGWRRAG